MSARRRGPERLSSVFSVRLPPALLSAVDAFVVKSNEADPLSVEPIGRTDVIRRALADYLRYSAAVLPPQDAPGEATSTDTAPSAPDGDKGPPRGTQGER